MAHQVDSTAIFNQKLHGLNPQAKPDLQSKAQGFVTGLVDVLLMDTARKLPKAIKNRLKENFKLVSLHSSFEALQGLSGQGTEANIVLMVLESVSNADIQFIARLRAEQRGTAVIVLSQSDDVNLAVKALKAGAYDYITLEQVNFAQLSVLIHRWMSEQSMDRKLAEYARLHQELTRSMVVRTFLSTDVHQSFGLKFKEDPFLSQYSFYLFQQFVEKCVQKFEGTIHSTAGDGMMICFERPWQAVQAARYVLDFLPAFNRTDNWLSQDFSIRLGIHTGPVVLGNNQTISNMFSKTLDVAGHIQKAGKLNRIEVSEETLSCIEDKKLFLPADNVVDGIRTYYLSRES